MLAELRHLLSASQPLLLFLVIGLGFAAGHVRVKGFSLGVSGVLFAGLAFGAWRAEGEAPLALAPQIAELGLILFVYAVGLTSGPGFFAALRRGSLRINAAVGISLLLAAAVAFGGARLMGIPPAMAAGVFCGSLTNTPALAAATESLPAEWAGQPAIAYSITYPFGVLGALLLFGFFAARHRGEVEAERRAAEELSRGAKRLVRRNFEVRNPALFDRAIGELDVRTKTGLVISRIRHNGDVAVPTKYTRLQPGDVVLVVAPQSDMEGALAYFGAASEAELEHDDDDVESRRIIVSRRDLVGRAIGELDLERRFNALVTRLRRADFDMSPHPTMRLEAGDRLMVVAPRHRMGEAAEFFGDSARQAAALDYAALTFGICAGVLAGMVPIPVPGMGTVTLGIAGGPLLAALVLGNRGRTGPLVWSIPYEANETLRHIGLLLFLAGVGVKAGGQLLAALAGPGALLFALGIAVTLAAFLSQFLLLRRWLGVGCAETLGAASGMHTQPASLAKAVEITGSDAVFIAYATTYPVAMIGKIILAQLIVRW